MQRQIARILIYRKKQRGRCLQKPFQQLNLPKGARLEPSQSLPDIGQFEYQQCPFQCTFYVGGVNGRVLHKSPFLEIPGVTLDTWCIDILHSWHYGPMSTFLTFTIRALLDTDIYQPAIANFLDKEESDKLCLLALKADLWCYYKQRRVEDPLWSKKGSEAGFILGCRATGPNHCNASCSYGMPILQLGLGQGI